MIKRMLSWFHFMDNYKATSELLAIREEQIGEMLDELVQATVVIRNAAIMRKDTLAIAWLKKYKRFPYDKETK